MHVVHNYVSYVYYKPQRLLSLANEILMFYNCGAVNIYSTGLHNEATNRNERKQMIIQTNYGCDNISKPMIRSVEQLNFRCGGQLLI